MIEYKLGSFLEVGAPFVVHGCNAQGVMGSGAASAVRHKYPEAYSTYRDVYSVCGLHLGDVSRVLCDDGVVLFNAITQEFYGRDGKVYVDYDAIRTSLRTILHSISSSFPSSTPSSSVELAMPMIGAGLGGGDWKIISSIIEEELGDTCVKPVVCVLDQNILDAFK